MMNCIFPGLPVAEHEKYVCHTLSECDIFAKSSVGFPGVKQLNVNLWISCLSSDNSPCLDVDFYSRFGGQRKPEHNDVNMNFACLIEAVTVV
jgi:hypothetical protein